MATSSNQENDSAAGNAYGGSALGVYPLSVLNTKWAAAAGESSSRKLSEDFKANQELDHDKADKYPDPYENISYLAHGCISMLPSVGEFVFGDSGSKTKPGAVIIQQLKSEFASLAKMTKLGSPDIRALTGLRMNPFRIRRPSSSMTPDRGWMPSLFPVMSRFNVTDWAVALAVSVMMNKLLSLLTGEDDSEEVLVRRERKDLGTLIVDNQDFELRILNGTVHST